MSSWKDEVEKLKEQVVFDSNDCSVPKELEDDESNIKQEDINQ